jgi:hypothetical protein
MPDEKYRTVTDQVATVTYHHDDDVILHGMTITVLPKFEYRISDIDYETGTVTFRRKRKLERLFDWMRRLVRRFVGYMKVRRNV